MFVFYFTQIALDIGFGTTWWLLKNTSSLIINGTMYLIRGPVVNEVDLLKHEIKLLKHDVDTLKIN